MRWWRHRRAAESDIHDSYIDAVASALIATALYWLAHAYADALGRRLSGEERLSVATLARALRHDWAIVRGAALPLAEGLALERAYYEQVLTTDDRNEGLNAFIEKRPPEFKGR